MTAGGAGEAPGIAGVVLRVAEAGLALSFPRLVDFPEYPAITLRGLLGHALLDRWKRGTGNERLFRDFFKPQDPLPAPFMLDCRPGAGRGHVLTARLRFFGSGAGAFTDFAEALAEWSRYGFGASRTQYGVFTEPPVEMENLPWRTGWRGSGSTAWRVEFVSPTQLFRGGSSLSDPGFIPLALAEGAARRLERLASAYGEAAGGLVAAARRDTAGAGVLRYSLEKVDLRRVSGIDGHEVAAGGLTGWVELRGAPELERWLAAGGILGVGKKIAAGNGRIRVERV
ncbi:MAG: CRISPR system precrRNA processing endoribonuclease RAMP protein Cas6 [Planctomycetota bacterium]|jgi:hypothetical protein|nr:CRISPR system precrRNA processing endoribonuclease RAMP protein Cas6 [Planctomycetota bacterium]